MGSKSPHQPFPLTPAQFLDIDPSIETSHYMGGIWGVVRPGQTWTCSDGGRYILAASPHMIFFLLKGPRSRIYMQTPLGFRGDVTASPYILAGRSAQGGAYLAVFEVSVIIGMFSCLGWGAFLIVLGTDVADFVIRNRELISKSSRVLSAVLEARKVLKQHAPLLYEKVFEAFLRLLAVAGKETLSRMPEETVRNPKVLGRLVGGLVGKLGTLALEQNLKTFVRIVKIVVTLLLSTTGPATAGSAGTARDAKAAARALVSDLKQIGVSLSQGDAEGVLQEAVQAAPRIQAALVKVQDAWG